MSINKIKYGNAKLDKGEYVLGLNKSEYPILLSAVCCDSSATYYNTICAFYENNIKWEIKVFAYSSSGNIVPLKNGVAKIYFSYI